MLVLVLVLVLMLVRMLVIMSEFQIKGLELHCSHHVPSGYRS
jgi:hypothetical protein